MSDISQHTEPTETSPKLTLQLFPTSTYSSGDSLARLSVLLEKEEDLTTQEVRSSLMLLESLGLKNPLYCSLRTSKVSFHTIGVAPLIPSSELLMNWGMTRNGKCLTATASTLLKYEKEYTLSDILEGERLDLYSLSDRETERLMKSKFRSDLEQTLHPFSVCPTTRAQGETLRVCFTAATLAPSNTKERKLSPITGRKASVKTQDITPLETPSV